jgi:hypothetical protein
MADNRMEPVLELLDGGPFRTESLSRAAAQAAAVLRVDGLFAGLGTGPAGIVLSWSHGVAAVELEDLQFTLGEGPGPDAAAMGAPVLMPDLARGAARWPMLVPAALALGVRGVFAVPLRVGAIGVGTLVAHRSAAGPLGEDRLADALVLADAVAVLMLHQRYSSVGIPSPGVGRCPPRGSSGPYRAEVHQAADMISVQLGVSRAEALVRLRGYAFALELPVGEVAAQLVARSLTFDDLDLAP